MNNFTKQPLNKFDFMSESNTVHNTTSRISKKKLNKERKTNKHKLALCQYKNKNYFIGEVPVRACLFDIYIVWGKQNFHFNFFDSTIVFSWVHCCPPDHYNQKMVSGARKIKLIFYFLWKVFLQIFFNFFLWRKKERKLSERFLNHMENVFTQGFEAKSW